MSHASTSPLGHARAGAAWTRVPADAGSGGEEESGERARGGHDEVVVVRGEGDGERDGLLRGTEEVSGQGGTGSSRSSGDEAPGVESSEGFRKLSLDETAGAAPATWLPYTLRRSYLVPLAVAALVLALVLAVLTAYSTHHSGLGTDDGSVGVYVARRYVPTVLAVLFTLAVTVLAEDVKRTEAFARLASPRPVTAVHTLFYVPRVWWKSAVQGLSSRRSGGRRSWVLSLSSLAAGVSVLVVSTFSSSVFVTREVLLRTPVQLPRYTPHANGSIVLLPRRETYTRTISGFLYNATTSLWVSGSHVVLPFVTPSTADPSVLQEGMWQAETKVLKLQSTCTPMVLAEKTDINITFSSTGAAACNGTCTMQSRGLKLRADDGCEVQLQTPIAPSVEQNGGTVISDPIDGYFTDTLALQGGMLWTNLSASYVSWQGLAEEHKQLPPIDSGGPAVLDQWRRTFVYSFSDQCRGRELLFVSPPWFAERIVGKPASWQEDYWANFTARAELCTPEYVVADVPVTAVIGGAAPRVFFDEELFGRRGSSVPDGLLDFDRLNDFAFGTSWLRYFPAPAGDSDVEGFEGVSMLLAKTFSLAMANLLSNSSLSYEASRLRSRFFGELVLSSVLDADVAATDDVAGASLKLENRVVVVPGVAIPLAVLLFLAACYAVAMLWFASYRRRPLNLSSDPAALTGVVPLLDVSSSTAADFRGSMNDNRTDMKSRIGHRVYSLQSGQIREQESGSEDPSRKIGTGIAKRPSLDKGSLKAPSKPEWRPAMLHKTWLLTLLFSLVAIATAMLVLRKFADGETLFQTAFVQQVNLNLFHASLSPHSIIATLIAVTVGLCWDSIDKSMRTLQPYLAMSREPSEPWRGISITYESSYWLWAAVKSARSKHWILCLVTIGKTLSQTLVIAMAAVFEQRTVIHTQATQDKDIMTTRSLITRQEPFDFKIGLGQRPFYLTDSLLKTSDTDWLYNALDDITLSTNAVPWTRDEWVFTPVNVTNRDDPSILYVTVADQNESDGAHITSSFNVTITTSALRSRLECEPVTVTSSEWLDSVAGVYPNRFDKSVTGHVLPMTVSTSSEFAAPIFSAPRRIACCTNSTNDGSQSVVAYWSSNDTVYDEQPSVPADPDEPSELKVSSGWTKDFAVKWIVGHASSTTVPGSESNFISNTIGNANETVLYFVEEPQISIMRCEPVIEEANAKVTFARDTSQVLHYELLQTPQPAIGAWDYAYDVVYDRPGSNSSRGNVSYGTFFLSQLLTAPHIVEPQMRSSMMVQNHTIENLAAERFALRDTDRGTNMDYMSYANFVLANKDPTALLNTTLLHQVSEKTFQTFFKHFVTTGRWMYGGESAVSRAAYEELWGTLEQTEKFDGVITERIQILSMNKVATWLSLTILFMLMLIVVALVVALQIVYPRTSMLRRVECLADVLAMVAGSDELVRLADEIGAEGMEKAGMKTRLGWFRDRRGAVRWGVEVVDGNVEWVDGPEKDQPDKQKGRTT